MSPTVSSHNHRAQLIWTGLVALVLGAVALHHAASPVHEIILTGRVPASAALSGSPARYENTGNDWTPMLDGRNVHGP